MLQRIYNKGVDEEEISLMKIYMCVCVCIFVRVSKWVTFSQWKLDLNLRW